MNRMIVSLISGIALGAVSWAIVPLVSDRFEPFDSEVGFYLGQAMLSAMAFYLGFSRGLRNALMFVVGIYIGSNLYSYTFGSPDARASAFIGLIMYLSLCLYPLASGILGKLTHVGTMKYQNWRRQNAAKRGAP